MPRKLCKLTDLSAVVALNASSAVGTISPLDWLCRVIFLP